MQLRFAVVVLTLTVTACGTDRNPAAERALGDAAGLESVRIRTEVVGTSASPVDLAVRPDDDRLYLVEHSGAIVRLDDGRSETVLDLRDRFVGHATEQGLTGLEFAADGRTAWTHGTTATGATTISEFAVGVDGVFELSSERTLLAVGGPPGSFHNAGDLHLLTDGSLLITLGDGEAVDAGDRPQADPNRVAHDPSTLRGSILRVTPTPADASQVYEIPADNPFAAGPVHTEDGRQVAGLPEVWSWGLRNPWKIDVDPITGALWIADVGNIRSEEINVVDPGRAGVAGRAADFGWSAFEGFTPQNDVPTALGAPINPVWTYDHGDARCAISGGAVYTGDSIPGLTSAFVFGDFCEGSLWAYDRTTGAARPLSGRDLGEPIPAISAVRTGPDGELYVLSLAGEVHRVVAA